MTGLLRFGAWTWVEDSSEINEETEDVLPAQNIYRTREWMTEVFAYMRASNIEI